MIAQALLVSPTARVLTALAMASLLLLVTAASGAQPLPERLALADGELARIAEQEEIHAIEDPAGNLAPALEKLAELGQGRGGRWKVRVAVYGDSNHAMDWPAGALRSRLGALFGYGGHGYLGGGQPWEWYQHTEMTVRHSRQGWRSYATTEPRFHESVYGHAGLLGIGSRGGWYEFVPTDQGPEANQRSSGAELSWLCRPDGGTFRVLLDGQPLDDIDAACPQLEMARRRWTFPEGRHTLRVEVTRGRVMFLGASFENDQPGVVVDGLGVSALSVFRMQQMQRALFIESMRARAYDLVILHTGSNMWSPQNHPEWAAEVIGRIREALGPEVPILILSPPDFIKKENGRYEGHKRMTECAQEKRQIAAAHKVAFWDFYAVMGGLGSVMTWSRRGWVQPDLIHFKPGFHELMWARLTRALLEKLRLHVEAPRAGGPTAPGAGILSTLGSRDTVPGHKETPMRGGEGG